MNVHDSQPGPSSAIFIQPQQHHQQQSRPLLASTDDLLARFHLIPAYDKYVRPHYNSPPSPKGKQRQLDDAEQAADNEDDNDGSKSDKKKKNSYKHLIKGIPGKHSTKKDDYLTTMMQIPPKQPIPIIPFDLKTQREAFSVSLEGLKGWNVNTLILESAQAREDRKRRKELKKLAKAHASAVPTPTSIPTPLATTTAPPTTTSTPKPRLSTTAIGTPRPTPPALPTPGPPPDPGTRGTKREYDDSLGSSPHSYPSSHPDLPSKPIVGARAGAPGVRPRPIKKQRMDSQGRESLPVQQPTPQGV